MSDPTLRSVAIAICSACLDGEGGECHTPGCALWLHRTDTLRVHPELYTELPSEKPIPDAPGWWITVVGRSVDDRVTEFRQIVSCDDGLLYEIDQDDGEMFPVSRFAPMRWYGPIALPWETT